MYHVCKQVYCLLANGLLMQTPLRKCCDVWQAAAGSIHVLCRRRPSQSVALKTKGSVERQHGQGRTCTHPHTLVSGQAVQSGPHPISPCMRPSSEYSAAGDNANFLPEGRCQGMCCHGAEAADGCKLSRQAALLLPMAAGKWWARAEIQLRYECLSLSLAHALLA